MAVKVLFYVQHLLGIGHAHRAALVSRTLAAAGMDVTIAQGGMEPPGLDHGPVRIAPLPAVRAADQSFKRLIDENGAVIDEAWRRRRADALLAVMAETRPDVLLLETWPFGRPAFAFELEPLVALAETRRPRPLIACSVRDILVTKHDQIRLAEMTELARRHIDLVLVHGDPALIPFEATCPPARLLADRIRYTGYVVADGADGPEAAEPGRTTDGTDEVIVSVGGGAVGLPLLRAALAARPHTALAEARWRLLAGPDLPEADVRELAARAPAGVIVERARPDFPALLGRCALSISQGGYNTLMDILRARCRAVVVPFATEGETEQRQRSRLLAGRGALHVVEDLSELAGGIAHCLAAPPPGPVDIAMKGASMTARLLNEGLLGEGTTAVTTPRQWSRSDAASPAWQRLADELDAWAAAGRTATLWWRDDDAVAATWPLARLRDVAGAAGVPVTLAVVPARATSTLAAYVATWRAASVFQHGLSHANHAQPNAKKAELDVPRPAERIMADIAQGLDLLKRRFGARALPVLVPPWNRIVRTVVPRLGELGIVGLSTFGARPAPMPGLIQVNSHIDILAWRAGGGFVGEGAALDAAVRHLVARRTGLADPEEPTGLLTHHLVHDAACWAFIERFLAVTTGHRAVRWLDGGTAFGIGA